MFKGINLEFRKDLEEANRKPWSFTFSFSFADLELVIKNGDRVKFRIISEELSSEIQKIIGSGSRPKFIKFSRSLSNINDPFESWSYMLWINLVCVEKNKEVPILSGEKFQDKVKYQNGVLDIIDALFYVNYFPLGRESKADHLLEKDQYYQISLQSSQTRTSAGTSAAHPAVNISFITKPLGSNCP